MMGKKSVLSCLGNVLARFWNVQGSPPPRVAPRVPPPPSPRLARFSTVLRCAHATLRFAIHLISIEISLTHRYLHRAKQTVLSCANATLYATLHSHLHTNTHNAQC